MIADEKHMIADDIQDYAVSVYGRFLRQQLVDK